LLAITGWLFLQGILNAVTQTICWSVIFFFASAGASSAYLTVSEIFQLETRALAIAFFYAVGTAIGGVSAPLIFGALIQTHVVRNVFFGVNAERQSLESVARPLSHVEETEAA
jgi:MFS family permease